MTDMTVHSTVRNKTQQVQRTAVGFYGLHVHEGVLERGAKVTGATVHFVDNGMDTGPIILQKAVEVQQGDTAKSLQQRVMEEAEWILLPRATEQVSKELQKGR